MTTSELRRLYPHASASTIRANEILEAQNSRQPVAELVRPERKPDQVQTLDRRIAPKKGRRESVQLRVIIISCRRRLLDDDNLIAGCKPLRDLIARYVGIDDADPRIKFDYDQVTTKGAVGTHVLISTTPK